MAELNKNYNRIMSELESKIKDPKELDFVKSKFSELSVMFMDTIERLVANSEKQLALEKKVDTIQKSLKRIENDIYIDDSDEDDCNCEDCNCDDCDCEDCDDCDCDDCDEECNHCYGDQMHDHDLDYEFEIVCPYCDYEFVTGKETNLKDKIECPNCHNIIELDWDDYCNGECDHCGEPCYNEELNVEESKVNEEENKDYKYTKSDDKKDKENKNTENNNSKQDNEDDM